MTVKDFLKMIKDSHDTQVIFCKKAKEIALRNSLEAADVQKRLVDTLNEKYEDSDSNDIVDESDVNDFNIASQALMNAFCFYMGAANQCAEGDPEEYRKSLEEYCIKMNLLIS